MTNNAVKRLLTITSSL